MDLNVRVIKAVECCPMLYKGQATLEERQVIWQQLSEQMQVPESVLKTHWHLLCGHYQRCLEKCRSTDETENTENGTTRSVFPYENEMAFMTPYIHARIAIAAANEARKQEEMNLAGKKEWDEPEFVITEKDLENATKVSSTLGEDYTFYELETYDGEGNTQHYVQPDEVDNTEIIETNHEDLGEEIIEHVDESGNIVIYEGGDLVTEDGEQIVVEDEEILQMDDQIEVQAEQIIEEVVDDIIHTEDEFIIENDTTQKESPADLTAHTMRLPSDITGKKFVRVMNSIKEDDNGEPNTTTPHVEQTQLQSTPQFAQEYTLTTRRRAIVLKATPRVQVELTDNAASLANDVVRQHEQEHQQDVAAGATLNVVDNTKKTENVIQCCDDKKIGNRQQQKHYDTRSSSKKNVNNKRKMPNSQVKEKEQEKHATTTTSTKAVSLEQNHQDTSPIERSEDTIFGELVSAMLKQMPPDRKRTTKKSIMDLLLT